MVSLGLLLTNHDQNQSDHRSKLQIPRNRCRSVVWIILVRAITLRFFRGYKQTLENGHNKCTPFWAQVMGLVNNHENIKSEFLGVDGKWYKTRKKVQK